MTFPGSVAAVFGAREHDGLNDGGQRKPRKVQSNIPQSEKRNCENDRQHKANNAEHQSGDGHAAIAVVRAVQSAAAEDDAQNAQDEGAQGGDQDDNHHGIHGAIAKASSPLLDNDDPENEGRTRMAMLISEQMNPAVAAQVEYSGLYRAGWRGRS